MINREKGKEKIEPDRLL
uniref:Uncharacterized protein n=1 Tax=Arundo donax TaxID=35708 RepID=A0A0A9ABG6_ARUDO